MSTTTQSPRTLLDVGLGSLICTDFGTPLSRNASRSSDGIERSSVQDHLRATKMRVAIGPDLPTDSGIGSASERELCSDPPNGQVAHPRQPLRLRIRVSEICFCVESWMGRDMNETTKCVIITAGCFHQRRNETWDIDIDTERRLCPLYTIIPHDSGGWEEAYDWDGTLRGTCIGILSVARSTFSKGMVAPDRSMALEF